MNPNRSSLRKIRMQKKEQLEEAEGEHSRKGGQAERDIQKEKLNCNHAGVARKSRGSAPASEVATSSLGNTITAEC